MQFKENANVYTLDNKKVGEIERVVLDPQTKEITHLIVRKGFLFTEDKVVPIDMVNSTKEDRITLKSTEDLEALPDFEQEQYVKVTSVEPTYPYRKGDAHAYYWYPVPGFASWRTQPLPSQGRPNYVIETWQNIPDGTVALKEGANVVTVDNKHVGDVERIFATPERERATHLLISKGLFLKEKKVVPTSWIKQVTEDQVYLTVSSDFIDRLPEYAPAS
ncbi:MAG: PRC-barrel domain-containing protein [Anaerolineae bacterium]